MKIQLRCAGRGCENAIYVEMDPALLGTEIASASWICVRTPEGLQPVCWPCAEKLELPSDVLDRVRQLHRMVQKGVSS